MAGVYVSARRNHTPAARQQPASPQGERGSIARAAHLSYADRGTLPRHVSGAIRPRLRKRGSQSIDLVPITISPLSTPIAPSPS
jgi:hypothetical protein